MSFGNRVRSQFVEQSEQVPVVGANDQAELMFETLKDLQAKDQTGKLNLLEDPSSADLRSEAVEELETESNDLLDRAKAAGIELADLYPSLNADVLLLLGAFYGVDPSELEQKMNIYRPIWQEGIDGKVPVAGGTAEDLKIVRGMRVGGEGKEEWSQQESGLYLRNEGRDIQRAKGGQIITDFNQHNGQDLNQAWFDPAAYGIVNAQRRLRGEPQLDIETFTRFLGMEDVSADGALWSPRAVWDLDRLGFYGSSGGAFLRGGVRFSVGQKPLRPYRK